MKLTFGADFEGWVMWRGKPVPVCGRLGGTKHEPVPFPEFPQFMYQEDGASAEFNVPVCTSPSQLAHAVRFAGSLGGKRVREAFGDEYSLLFSGDAEFNMGELFQHPQAMTVGCDPDFTFDTGAPRTVDTSFIESPYRFAGGHIHVGYTEHELMSPAEMAGCIFSYLRNAGVDFEMGGLRRQFYPITAFRPKPYGVEYRGLSSRWCGDPAQMDLVVSGLDQLQTALTKGARKVVEECADDFWAYSMDRRVA